MMNPNQPELATTEVGLWVFEKFLFLFIYSFILFQVCLHLYLLETLNRKFN